MRACSSGVSFGSSRSGSSDGSPTGSEPSGSRRAARWPCVRCALTSAIAAATPPSSCASTAVRRQARPARRGRGAAAARGRCRAAVARPRGSRSSSRASPGWVATSSRIAALEERRATPTARPPGSRGTRRAARARSRHSARRRRACSSLCCTREAPELLPCARPALEERVVREHLQRRADDEADPDDREAEPDQPLLARAHHGRDRAAG